MKGLLQPFALVVGAALSGCLLEACNPDVPQNAPPASTIVVAFDPGAATPVVPTPNDLAIDPATHLVVVPTPDSASDAQKEFNTQYLGTLGGFPFESTAAATVSGALDPTTVNEKSVLAFDLTVAATTKSPAPVAVTPTYDPTTNTVSIPPPGGAWIRAHQYAIAFLAGPTGLRGAKGEAVIGSQTWELVSGQNPLVTGCPNGDIASSQCELAVDVIPSTKTDPAARIADELANAQKLETLRLQYAPLVASVEQVASVPREQIPILWTFTIVDAGEVTFDPANNIVPFPNDIVRSAGKVTLPNPSTGIPPTTAECAAGDATLQLICGLNTLDGFSTIAPPISENGATAGALEQANIDPTTLNTATVGLTRIATTAPPAEQTTPNYSPCLNCLSSTTAQGMPQTSPQQLQWQLVSPLDEQTTYLGYVTDDIKDTTGASVIANPAFALVRLSNPLVVNGHSAVNIITDAQASQLEPLRAALQPAIDSLGVPRTKLALAWAFTTQSEATQLDQLRLYPNAVPALPDSPLYVYDATTQYRLIAAAGGYPNIAANVSKVLVGAFLTPVAVTGPGGTFDTAAPQLQKVTFVLTLPMGAAPAGGYPLTIFGHGFTRSHGDFLAIAGRLADPSAGGQATIATDVIFHGERTSCTGSGTAPGAMPPTDDGACADPTTQKCNEDPLFGRCIARDPTTRLPCRPATADDYQVCAIAGQGACVGTGSTGTCEGGDFMRDDTSSLTPALNPFQRPTRSGWNIFSLSNFFSTRDNLRQQVIDLSQLARVIKSTASTSLSVQASAAASTAVSFDVTRLGYVGQSLGGILGTLYNAVSPDTTNVVLNVPGGDLPQIILGAPSFVPYRMALLSALSQQGISVGTPQFDQFIGFAQWVLDPADPANMAWRLTHTVTTPSGVQAPNAKRAAFIQFIEGDETVPNFANLAVVTGANRSFVATPPSFNCTAPLFCYEFTDAADGFDTTSTPTLYRHGFLLAPPWPPAPAPQPPSAQSLALTTKAQTQVANFLALGHL